ncbi:MAG: 3-dehydroquinate synthase family protein [Planctomycetota bacterium]|nr:3-dehydroquinate synthase family protein [Planctomycetota bacterium]
MSEVRIGSGVRHELWEHVRRLFPGAARAGWVIDPRMFAAWEAADGGLPDDPEAVDVTRVVEALPGHGEALKTREVLALVQDALIELRRDEPLIAMGGGATTDVAGFAAATLRRGMRWIAMPTTVVGMVDAAIGGKTGINHPRGKNLLGAFHEPALVLIDVDFLKTLDARDVTAGTAEVYKVGRLGDAALRERLADGCPPVDDAEAWIELVKRAVAVKRTLVEGDLLDLGQRRLLNYGHTVGHALETLLGNERMRHGEAIAIGMQVAIQLAASRDLVDDDAVAGQKRDLEALELPTRIPDDVSTDAVLEGVGLDKKRQADAHHTMVLPTGAAGATVVTDVSETELRSALDATR